MNFKFGVIKKNQILASMVVLMLVVAGYLNYTYDPTENYHTELTEVMSNHLGDAYLVDSSSISTIATSAENVVSNMDDIAQTIEASGKVTTAQEYFASTRMERENQFDEQKETYEKMLSNPNLEETQKSYAQQEIAKINVSKNAISIAENLIKLKGYQDVVILHNENSTNVIVLADSLTEAQKQEILTIVVTELKVAKEEVVVRTI